MIHCAQVHLFFSRSRQVIETVVELVKSKTGKEVFWMGIDDRDQDQTWTDR